MCIIDFFRLYNMEENCLMLTYMTVNKVEIDYKSYWLRLKESYLLKSKHQTQRSLLYCIASEHVQRMPLSNYHVNSD